ncbi:hypothetical protein EV424DRAFT_1641600 [Suillus variegatus]|nr:hypothetical protein EV424DRAFT_1641600 [Suillus variegatus]
MTYVSNDPSYWPYISLNIFCSYWAVAASVMMVYDWVLTLGQEIELIWTTMVSHDCAVFDYTLYWNTCQSSATTYAIGIANKCSAITYYAVNGTNVALTTMLGVIMIARLHAMYQGSRKMLMFIVIIFLAVNIACGVITAIALNDAVAEEFILSGRSMCNYVMDKNLLSSMVWMLNTVWEVLALCLSVWVAVKHFCELRRLDRSTGSTIGDCFRVLIQSHVLYFASFVGVSCLELVTLSPEIAVRQPVADICV